MVWKNILFYSLEKAVVFVKIQIDFGVARAVHIGRLYSILATVCFLRIRDFQFGQVIQFLVYI